MNTRSLTMFSVFMATYFCVSSIAGSLPAISDVASAIVIALFYPFIGLRNYLVFLVFRVIFILTEYPRLYEITYNGALIASLVDSDGLPFSGVVSVEAWGHLIILITYIIFYIVQPYLIYRGLRKFGFYGLVSGVG